MNIKDGDGKTALMFAISNGNYNIAKKLVEAGANLDIQCRCGQNALELAIEMKQYKIAALLKKTK